MLNRRDVLKALAATSVGALLPRPQGAAASGGAHHADDRPRYHVFIFLSGGADAVYTADPRTKSEVAAEIDVPYGADAIKSFGKDVRVGPHLGMLGDHVRDLAIVKGVHTHVLNHVSGTHQFLRLRIGGADTPSICSVLASQRDTQAVGELYISFSGFDTFVPRFLGSAESSEGPDFFELLDQTSPEDLKRLAKIYRRQHDELARDRAARPEQVGTATNLDECSRLFDRVAQSPHFKAEDWGPSDAGPDFQRALWALENDLACSVFIAHRGWDTHNDNAAHQTVRANKLYPVLARFMSELKTRRNRFGTLWDNTVLLFGSELGRFPRLNKMLGKDHFPEAPYILAGKGIKPGVYGATGKELEALPISFDTGRAKHGGDKVSLNDLSATMLARSGINPLVYGYTGRQLSFLFG